MKIQFPLLGELPDKAIMSLMKKAKKANIKPCRAAVTSNWLDQTYAYYLVDENGAMVYITISKEKICVGNR